MEIKVTSFVVIMLVAGLLVGTTAGYYLSPTKTEVTERKITVEVNPLDGKTIQIGNIVGSTVQLEFNKPLNDDIIQKDINEYAKKLGYDVTFSLLLEDAAGQAAIHLEKMQSFKSIGVELVVGGRWSSQASASIGYVNQNDMLLVSPSSSSPLLAIAGDRLYRLCPTDFVQAPSISEMLWSWGIKAVVVMHKADAYGDGIWNIFNNLYPAKGGIILDRVRYAEGSQEFSSYLASLDTIVGKAIKEYGIQRVGVLLLAQTEASVILTQAVDYNNIMSVVWMSNENTGRDQMIIDNVGEPIHDLKLFSSIMAPAQSWKFDDHAQRYYKLTGLSAGFLTATAYDSAMTLALAILETQSSDASDVVKIYPATCSNYFGVSGWCDLDEYGDRKSGLFDIWGYYKTPEGELTFTKYGEYNGIVDKVTWYYDLLQQQGESPPGPG